jgi:hypothetical protein
VSFNVFRGFVPGRIGKKVKWLREDHPKVASFGRIDKETG